MQINGLRKAAKLTLIVIMGFRSNVTRIYTGRNFTTKHMAYRISKVLSKQLEANLVILNYIFVFMN